MVGLEVWIVEDKTRLWTEVWNKFEYLRVERCVRRCECLSLSRDTAAPFGWAVMLNSVKLIPIVEFSMVRESSLIPLSFIIRFSDDIEFMTGSRPNIFWKICWMFITPVAMFTILVASIVLMSQGKASYFAWNRDKVRKLTSFVSNRRTSPFNFC